MDKKISELAVIQSINADDVSILVSNGTDYQFAFDTLLGFIGNNLSLGAAISFGITLPQNNTGKNGDLFINTQLGSFAQKIAGIWTIIYNPASVNMADGTVLYGLGTPSAGNGKNGDTYINTGTGTFYKKAEGSWSVVFSMLNGPPGVKGDKGDKGDTGAKGNTVLNGSLNPSNLSDGVNGDFYLNTASMVLFGPKANNQWASGTALQAHDSITIRSTDSRINYNTDTLTMTINWDADLQSQFSGLDAPLVRFQRKLSNNSYQDRPDLYPVFNDNGTNITTLAYEGVTPDLSDFKLIITR